MTHLPLPKQAVQPIRSLALVAADRALITKAREAGADALWMDLEEPQYPYDDKARVAARASISEYMESDDAAAADSPLAFVRVSLPHSGETLGDLRAAVTPALKGVILPKVDTPADIHRLEGLLSAIELERGIALGTLQIIPLLESAIGMRLAYEIGIASPRVTYMGGMLSAFGDVHRELGYRWTPQGDETNFMRAKILMDTRAAGIRYPISGMWAGANDDIAGMSAWAHSLRELGYYGMVSTVELISLVNEIFSPTEKEIEYWTTMAAQGDIIDGFATDAGDYPMAAIPGSYIESAHWNLEWAKALGRVP